MGRRVVADFKLFVSASFKILPNPLKLGKDAIFFSALSILSTKSQSKSLRLCCGNCELFLSLPVYVSFRDGLFVCLEGSCRRETR